MPIYAYKCATCGHAADVMQKMSEPPRTVCPSCGAETFAKQITAPNFALKGSGWYVTDFRNGNTSGKESKDATANAANTTTADPKSADTKPADASAATSSSATPAAGTASTAPAPSAAPATSAPASN
jgi:putative FmdB family regulatory protein